MLCGDLRALRVIILLSVEVGVYVSECVEHAYVNVVDCLLLYLCLFHLYRVRCSWFSSGFFLPRCLQVFMLFRMAFFCCLFIAYRRFRVFIRGTT